MYLTDAQNLKNQAAQAKRTCTSLNKLIAQLDLNDSDKKTLLRAEVILATNARSVKRAAINEKAKEDKYNLEMESLQIKAKKLIDLWPTETLADKFAIIQGDCSVNLLSEYIDEKNVDELDWYIDSMLGYSIKSIVWRVANLSVKGNESIDAVASKAQAKLDVLRSGQVVKNLLMKHQNKVSK